MRKYIIELLGGFSSFDDAIEHVKKTNNEAAKNALITEAVKKTFNIISADDILKMDERGQWYFTGKPLTPADILSLKEEARILRGMKLWRILRIDIQYQLNKKMFEESRLMQDLISAKLLSYLDSIIRTRLQSLK